MLDSGQTQELHKYKINLWNSLPPDVLIATHFDDEEANNRSVNCCWPSQLNGPSVYNDSILLNARCWGTVAKSHISAHMRLVKSFYVLYACEVCTLSMLCCSMITRKTQSDLKYWMLRSSNADFSNPPKSIVMITSKGIWEKWLLPRKASSIHSSWVF